MSRYDSGVSIIIGENNNVLSCLDDVIKLIKSLSTDKVVIDNISEAFSNDSVTYLYSGGILSGNNRISSLIIANSFENARTLDRTAAGHFLANEDFEDLVKEAIRNDINNGMINELFDYVKDGMDKNSEKYGALSSFKAMEHLEGENMEDAIDFISQAFIFEPTKGAWAIASANFIAATPENSRIESIVPDNVNLGRTWATVEVPTALDKLPDNIRFGTSTIGELKALRDEQGLAAVLDKLKAESTKFTNDILTDDTKLHYDEKAKIIGLDLPPNASVFSSDQMVFSASLGELKNYLSGTEMSSKYAGYDALSDIDKLKARKGNYLYAQRGFNLDNIEFPQSDPAVHFADIGKNPDLLGDVTICFDQDGQIAAMDIASITGDKPLFDSGKYIDTITINEWTNTHSDIDMGKYNGFDALSDLDKHYAKTGLDIYKQNGFELADGADINEPDFSKRLVLAGKQQFLAGDSKEAGASRLESFTAASPPPQDESEMTEPGASDFNRTDTKNADQTLNTDAVQSEGKSGENTLVLAEAAKRPEAAKGSEAAKGPEATKSPEAVKGSEAAKGPEPAKGRKDMASWKAQIAQMKANEESSKKPLSLKMKEVGRER